MRTATLLIALGSMALVGAGCGTPASVSKTSNQPSLLDAVPLPEEVSTVSPTSDSSIQQPPMQKTWTFPGVLSVSEISGKQVRLKTAKGDIVFELFEKDAPKTVSNFVYLAKGGYFDGLTFHRREPGFVIQGGDPNGNGTGGPGYKFEDEPVSRSYSRGIVAMANSGPDTNGSQFFIMLADTQLPPSYTIFGNVVLGMDVVERVAVGDVMATVTIEGK